MTLTNYKHRMSKGLLSVKFQTSQKTMKSHCTKSPQLIIICNKKKKPLNIIFTVSFLSFRTDRSGQTVQTQIRVLLEEHSDQGLHCLQFPLHLLDALL